MDELLSENNQWQTVEAVVVEDEPLEAYNLSVDEYATYFLAGDADAEAVWVHNACYNRLPDGFTDTGRVTDYGQPIFTGDDGRILYVGNDSRYYDLEAHPPSADPNWDAATGSGSAAHKADAWKAYQEREHAPGKKWSYERWSNTYDVNMTQASKARVVETSYQEKLGWGEVNKHTVNVPGTGEKHRLDIVDLDGTRGVEVKSGKTSATVEVLSEVRRDKLLKDEGWDIEWHFDGKPMGPLLRALDEAGIRWTIRDSANLPKGYKGP